MARIRLANPDDLPEADRDLLETLSARDLPDEYDHLLSDPVRDVYRLFGRSPSVLRAFRTLGRTAWADCGVDARGRELVILTVARERDSAYQWHQHVRVGLSEGLTPEELRALSARDLDGFDADERTLMAYVQAVVRDEADAELVAEFVDAYDEPTLVGVGTLVGVYVTIDLLESAVVLATEEPFVGWDLEHL